MNKKIFAIILMLISMSSTYAQNVGFNTSTPHASAALDIVDSTRGLLIPRMTDAQRFAIPNPAIGLMVFQTNATKGFYYFDGIGWSIFSPSSAQKDMTGNGILIGGGRGATFTAVTLTLDSSAIAKFLMQSPSKDSAIRLIKNNIATILDSTSLSNRINTKVSIKDLTDTLSTITFAKNTTRDSIILTVNGRKYSVRDSILDINNLVKGKGIATKLTYWKAADTLTRANSIIVTDSTIMIDPASNNIAMNTLVGVSRKGYGADDGQASIYAYRTRESINSGTSYEPSKSNAALISYNDWGDPYSFGTSGYCYNDSGRSGGVLGSKHDGTYWGALGYKNSASATYGVYGTAAYASGTGFLPNTELNGIGGGFFGAIGSTSKGSVIGQLNEGELFAQYNKGDVYTSGKQIELVSTSKQVTPAYAVTSNEVTVNAKGKIKMIDGEVEVKFDANYTTLLGEEPIITATPLGECQGVYISEISKNGFKIKELNHGHSNVTISWIAIGNRIDADETQVPSMLTQTDFNRNLSQALHNDVDTKHNGLGMWWDGQELKFGKMPESFNAKARVDKAKLLEKTAK